MLLAREPWSGHYEVRENLWAYAHYGQFSRVGWHYVDDGCIRLRGGGSMVTLRDPATGDYSLIVETKDATAPQTIRVRLSRRLPARALCQWVSTADEQFVRRADVRPHGRTLTLTLQPGTVYSFSTTTGQQKGSFADVPASKPFPLPYNDDFDGYGQAAQWGYLPHYMADLIGAFELTPRPDHQPGACLRQVVGEHTVSWAPEWHHYTILGDSAWTDYEVSADVWLNPGDEAALMGRLCDVGTGYGIWAKGYYLKLSADGRCQLVITQGKRNKGELIGDAEQQALIRARKDREVGGEYVLDSCRIATVAPCQWHRLALRFEGEHITGLVDGESVVTFDSPRYPKGMAGLMAPLHDRSVCTPYFDNVAVRPLGRTKPVPTTLPATIRPLYELNAKQ